MDTPRPVAASKVRRIFDLDAFGGHTLDSLVDKLGREQITFTDATPRFGRAKLYDILKSRAYIGEVVYQGRWYPGTHEPLIDHATFQRVQRVLGGQSYRSHEMTFAGELITCGHCGLPITGERKTRKAKSGERHYVYYRCTRYSTKGHPRTRVTEASLDE